MAKALKTQDDAMRREGAAAAPPTSSAPATRRKTERPDRRADILLAAETLFADRGYGAVTVRDIAAAAAVPIALVGYYFGRKEELLNFIFAYHRHSIDERCRAMEAVSGRPGPARAARIIRAWTEPVLRERAEKAAESFSTLVARSIWEAGEENRRIVERYYDPLARTFIRTMGQALPERDEASIIWSYQFALGALLTFIADNRVERLSNGRERTADPSRGEQLIAFITAGFLAAA